MTRAADRRADDRRRKRNQRERQKLGQVVLTSVTVNVDTLVGHLVRAGIARPGEKLSRRQLNEFTALLISLIPTPSQRDGDRVSVP